MRRAAALLLGAALAGGLFTMTLLRTPDSELSTQPALVEVPLGKLAGGSSVGSNATNGSVTVTTLPGLRSTNLFYLNNTNATGAWYAKLSLASSSGVPNLLALNLGIRNSTTSVSQIAATAGVLTQTGGAYVRLEPGSSNVLYMDARVAALGVLSSLKVDVTVGQATDDRAIVVSQYTVNLA